jgi:hypothetical protein
MDLIRVFSFYLNMFIINLVICLVIINSAESSGNSSHHSSHSSANVIHIDEPPIDSKVILSSTAELKCRVRHEPNVDNRIDYTIVWTFNGPNTRVNASSRVTILNDGSLRIEQVFHILLYYCVVIVIIFVI